MKQNLGAIAFAAVALTVTSCASTGASSAEASAPRTPVSKDVMDASQLTCCDYASIYQAILANHAEWMLAGRGTSSLRQSNPTPVVGVFMDGSHRSSGAESLKQLKPEIVKSVRHLSPSESREEYGLEFQWGAIVVTLLR